MSTQPRVTAPIEGAPTTPSTQLRDPDEDISPDDRAPATGRTMIRQSTRHAASKGVAPACLFPELDDPDRLLRAQNKQKRQQGAPDKQGKARQQRATLEQQVYMAPPVPKGEGESVRVAVGMKPHTTAHLKWNQVTTKS